MSEHVLKILLSELVTVRVRCRQQGCGAIVEIPTEELDQKFHSGLCPFCRAVLQLPQNNHLAELARALRELKAAHQQVEVQFVIPQKAPSAG